MPEARVTSFEALVDFRAATATFLERAQAGVGSLRHETQRTLLWLEQEQPRYWAEEVRRSFDRVAAARTAYETCRLRTVAGHRSACIEEQQALRKAKHRLEYCQSQQDVVRQWGQRARDQADEFFGKLGPLERMLDHDLPLLIGELARRIQSLEAYVATHEPTEGELAPGPADPPTAGDHAPVTPHHSPP
jgi:hypothetical protein